MGNEVTTGKPKAVAGAIYTASKGSTLPTSLSGALDNAFKSVGYISEDGVDKNTNYSSEDIKCWGGSVVASEVTERGYEFKFKMISKKNEHALKLAYGSSSVTVTDTKITVAPSGEEEDVAVVIEMKDSRIVLPNARLKELGTITYKDSDAVGYEVTLAAQLDDAGKPYYEYM